MRTVRLSLAGVALALLLAGLTSGDLLRAGILLTPMLFASRLCVRAPAYLGAYAAVTLFGYWMLTVGWIWLSLLRGWVPAGRYSPFEIAMSGLIVFFAVVGLARGVRAGRPLATSRKILTAVLFAALQTMAVAASVLAPIGMP